jgi:8-oxo-dGTP pyrophosphatase MutT (NUDIX family)
MPVAYALARYWYAWRRPERRTAAVVVWHDDRVLTVAHSYKPGWTLPGGGVLRHEAPEQGAARELREETGIRVDPADLRLVDVTVLDGRYGKRTTWFYELHLAAPPRIRVNGWETTGAAMIPPSAVPALVELFRASGTPLLPRRA